MTRTKVESGGGPTDKTEASGFPVGSRAKVRKSIIVLLIVCLTSGFISAKIVKATGTMQTGVNFLEGYTYEISEETLQNEMKVFQQHKITLIFLDPQWTRIEPSRGTFDDTYLNWLEHIVGVAGNYGISVALAVFTNTDPGSLTIPSWVSPQAYQTVITDVTFRSLWLDMLGHLASIFRDSVYAYIPLDEPQFSIDHISPSISASTCLSLWQDAKTRIRQYSTKPFAIRFESAHFNDFKNEPNFYTVNDFACINFYTDWTENHNPPNGNDPVSFATQAAEVKAKGKLLIIGGCGYASIDESVQSYWLKHDLDIFNANGVDYAMAWYWSSNSWLSSPGWNLCADTNGNPRSSFTTLTSYNSGISPPTVQSNIVQNFVDAATNLVNNGSIAIHGPTLSSDISVLILIIATIICLALIYGIIICLVLTYKLDSQNRAKGKIYTC